MNLPREYWTAKVQGVPESMRTTIHRYLVNTDIMLDRGAGMFLTGPAGVGKTGIASLVCKEARSRGYTVYFTSVWELRECVKSKVMFEETTSVLDRCREVDVLVLDGLREEDQKDYTFGSRAIEELLVGRGTRKRVSIVTSRLDMRGIDKFFPGLLEAVQGCMVVLPVTGEDLRRAQSEELKRAVLGIE
jgi:DNA replication protein DnaC